MADYDDNNPFTDSLNQAATGQDNSPTQNPPVDVEPPNPWFQGLGMAANGILVPSAPTLNPHLQGILNGDGNILPQYRGTQTATDALNAALQAYIAGQNSSPAGPSLQGITDANGNITPDYLPANAAAAPLQTGMNAYLAGQSPQSIYPGLNPAPVPTGYDAIVPQPQSPFPGATPNQQPTSLINNNPQWLSNTPPPQPTAPNPIDPNLVSPTNDYFGKILTGPTINPYTSNLPEDPDSMMRTGNPPLPSLPQNLGTLLSPTTDPYSPDLPQDTTSVMRQANSPFSPDLPQDTSSMMRIVNTPNANENPPTEFRVLASEFAGGTERGNMESAYPPKHQVDPDTLGAALPVHFPLPLDRFKVRVTNPVNGITVDVPIVDVGPHNIHDPYWTNAARNYRPLSEEQYAQKLPSQLNTITRNSAGIDLTPATMNALGVKGQENDRTAPVIWRFIPNASSQKQP